MAPQATAFTWILLGASSFASALVNASSPPLEAEYATSQEAPALPQTEEILIIFPAFLETIWGTTSLEQLKAEVRLVFMISFHFAMSISVNSPMWEMPALLTRTSIVPNCAMAFVTISSAVS